MMQVIDMGPSRRRVDSGTIWEPKMGYSRAVQVGPMIFVAGCIGVNPDGSYPPRLEDQTRRCVERIEQTLDTLGATLADVVRVRIYTTRIDNWGAIASVMGKVFGEIRPANALIGVDRLVDPDAHIEIEADAVIATMT